jgi:hypothetical protein
VSTDFQPIAKSKAAERQRLRELPWLEKLEMLDKLKERHLLLRKTREVQQQPRKTHD